MPSQGLRFQGLGNLFDTFRDSRDRREQRTARQDVANSPNLSADERINRFLGAGLTQEAGLESNRDVNNRRLEQGDQRIQNQVSQFNQTFSATQSHRAAQNKLGRMRFNLVKAGVDKKAAQGIALQQYFDEAGVEREVSQAAIAAGQGNVLFKHTLPDKTKSKQLDGFGLPVGSSDSNQMNMLLRQGVDEQAALGIVSGRNVVSVNPQNGERVLIDKATNQIVPLRQPQVTAQNGTAQQNPLQSQGPTDPGLFSMAEDATGVIPGAAAVLSDTLGQIPGAIGEATTFPGAVKAVQEFNLFKRDLIKSLSLNPRFPIAEQKRIENLVPRGALTSSGTLKQSLKALDRELARLEQRYSRSSQDRTAPVSNRSEDTASLHAVQAARQRLGIPNDRPRSNLENKYGLE